MQDDLAPWQRLIDGVVERCRLGHADPLEEARRGAGALAPLVARLGAAQDAGYPLLPGLKALRVELQQARALQTATSRLWRLIVMRLVLAAALVVAARLGLAQAQAGDWPPDLALLDRRAGILGVTLLVLGLSCLHLGLPRVWISQPAASEPGGAGVAWVGAYLEGEAAEGEPWGATLRALMERELALGVGLLAEKREVLVAWAARQGETGRERLRLLEELLPLWELGVIGLTVTLFLLAPLLAFLRG